MKYRSQDQRKTYGTQRMLAAIERAIDADTDAEKERAARWATAWGALSGLRSPGLRLRRSVLIDPVGRNGTQRHVDAASTFLVGYGVRIDARGR